MHSQRWFTVEVVGEMSEDLATQGGFGVSCHGCQRYDSVTRGRGQFVVVRDFRMVSDSVG